MYGTTNSSAGTNLWNRLCKEFRPNNGTFYAYVKSNIKHFHAIAEQAEQLLPSAIKKVQDDLAAGQKSIKLSKALFINVFIKLPIFEKLQPLKNPVN